MAFSSPSPPFSSKKYDVFISFRGEDTRCNFISHLHDGLCRNKIETYIDDRLEKGNEVWPSLVEAIQDSMLFLIVFSENYATSTWCLNELTKILDECFKDEGHRVIPVFYKIDPSHIRKQTGSYKEAFTEHEQSRNKQHVSKWRASLTQAANLSGWDSSAYRNEAELIREIVKGVSTKLNLMDQSVYSNDLIGISEQLAHVESLMCIESKDIRFIGIWGMGGIGKTTIAKVLFDKFCFAFEGFCFLANVKEESEKYGIVNLKNKLLSTLLGDSESYVGMPDGGSTYFRRRLGRKKVLLVLDDVNDAEQLENLAGAHHWFGQGSRIIITTRDKQVLGKNIDSTYEVKALGSSEAIQLFNLNAFENNYLDEEFQHLSQKVIEYANGIPLALVVLGSLLYGKDKYEWECQLKKLRRIPNTKIQQILKLSYDGLDREEKDIFLFVACFFKGKDVEQIKDLLDACGYSTTIGLKILQNKALLDISQTKVLMHDLIQEMGLEIVREESLEDPEKRSRLWDANDICQVLKNNKGSEAIKSIRLDISKMEELNLSPDVFGKMQNLLFLEFYNSNYSKRKSLHLSHGLGYFPTKLRYLSWDNYPLKSLPLTFSAENIVTLNMRSSRMRKLWHGVQNLVNLKSVDLSFSENLIELPDFSKATNLNTANFSLCSSLREVHPSILSLDKLEVLDLIACIALTSLKSDVHLRSLCYLWLGNCSNLKEFSITSENIKYLDLSGTAIHELPSPCIERQSKLGSLHLKDCKSIPRNLFDGLQSLEQLELDYCCNTFKLVDHISMLLSSLTRLSIKGNDLESLPASIKHLSSLQSLTLENCESLRSASQLPSTIRALQAKNCSSLEIVQFAPTAVELEPFKQDKREYDIRIKCQSCQKLDQNSVKAILANALSHLNKCLSKKDNGNHDHVQVIYPGSRIPEWFRCRSTGSYITIDLSSAPVSRDWTLLFCLITPAHLPDETVIIIYQFKLKIISEEGEVDGHVLNKYYYLSDNGEKFSSHHVHLSSIPYVSFDICRIIKESKATSHRKISLETNFSCHLEIKECGVCPTYASEYQNFIKEMEMEMEMESQVRASELGVGCSYQKDLIFPTPTWKNKTQGFKDIIYL